MIAHTIPNQEQHGKNQLLPEHRGLIVSAIAIFKENILIGDGIKTFRINCRKLNFKNIDLNKFEFSDVINSDDCKIYTTNKKCSTHPHNYYLQLIRNWFNRFYVCF